MTVSDAMRLGAAVTEQCYGDLFQRDGWSMRITKACAWGALLIGADKLGAKPSTVYQDFPELAFSGPCPVAGCDHMAYLGGRTMTMDELITHLNDDHRWTREAIADWIDTLNFTENENATEEICAAV